MGKKEIAGIKEFIKKLKTDFKISKVILFGSRASGKSHKNSDIDLIIVSDGFRKLNFIERASKMYDYWELKYPVDFLCYTPEEFNSLKRRITIVKETLKEGIVL